MKFKFSFPLPESYESQNPMQWFELCNWAGYPGLLFFLFQPEFSNTTTNVIKVNRIPDPFKSKLSYSSDLFENGVNLGEFDEIVHFIKK